MRKNFMDNIKKKSGYTLVLFLLSVTSVFSQWEPINNGLNGGVVANMVTINGVLWATGQYGGLYSSTDEGNSWHHGNKSLGGITASYLFSHENVLFANEGFNAYRSTDKGSTWEENSIQSDKYYVQGFLTVGKTLYAILSEGLMFSADTGKTWNRKTLPENSSKIDALSLIDTSIYVSVNSYVYRTDDNCKTWIKLEGLLPYRATKLVSYLDNIYAISGLGLYVSTNKGKTWIKSVQGLENTNSIYDIVKVDEKLFAGAVDGVYESENKGKNWSRVFESEHNEAIYKLLYSNGKIFAGTYRRIIYSKDSGVTWSDRMNGFSCLQTKMLSRYANKLLVSTEDEMYLSTNSGNDWSKVECNENKLQIGNIALTNDMIYVSIGAYILYSSDNGKKWDTIKYEKSIKPFCGMVAFEDKLYIPYYDYINVTSDKGKTWKKVEKFSGYELTSISVSQGKMYASDVAGYVFRRQNDSTWVRSEATPNQSIGARSCVATTEKTTYALHGSVYRKKSTSPIWEPIYDGLPIYSYYPNWLHSNGSLCFVAMNEGVFVLKENESKWSDMSEGLINKTVSMIQSDDNYLYVCTNGSGVFRYPLTLAGTNEEYNNTGTFGVYPNPHTTNEKIHINIPEIKDAEYMVVNLQGEKILEGKLEVFGDNVIIEGTETLPAGIYSFVVRTNDKEIVQKFIVCK